MLHCLALKGEAGMRVAAMHHNPEFYCIPPAVKSNRYQLGQILSGLLGSDKCFLLLKAEVTSKHETHHSVPHAEIIQGLSSKLICFEFSL